MVSSSQEESKSVFPVGAIASYLAFMVLLVLFQTFWEYVASGKDMNQLNLVVPSLFGTANLLLAWKLLRQSPLAIWNPLFWLLLACTLYYGLGQLVHLLGHPDTVQRVNTLYVVSPVGLARTNLLNTVCILTIVAAYLATMLMTKLGQGGVSSDVSIEAQERQGFREAKWAVLLFLSIGLPIKYFLQLPYDLGLLKWVLPGSIKYLGTLSGVAIIPLYWLYKRHSVGYGLFFFLLLGSELLAALVTLSKLEMIRTVLFVVLGVQLVKPGLKKLALSGIAIIMAYVLFVNPFVSFSRTAIGRAAATDLSQAMSLVDQYKKRGGPVQDVEFPQAQLWWARLAYSNVELFAMQQYDKGRPGTTFQLAPYTLIPRFIMPEKPWMSPGIEFTSLIIGNPSIVSSTGLGVPGEGYWNGGWLGVALVGVVVGVLLAAFHQFSIRAIQAQIFMFLPISMAGILLGLRIDDWFVTTYLGMTAQLFLLYLIMQYALRPILFGIVSATEHRLDQRDTQEEDRRQFPVVSR